MQKRIESHEGIETVGDLVKVLKSFNQDFEVRNQFDETMSVSLYEDVKTKERVVLIDGV